jgi:alpha-1,6-mannosyltransferase
MSVVSGLTTLEDQLYPTTDLPAGADLARAELPARLRPEASLSVLDITKWFSETSGGVRTYLLQKARYMEARQWLRHTLVIPGAHDSITSGDGTRCYRLRGPSVPTQRPYRFMLATRSIQRIVGHERPDVIEVGSPFLVPWITRRAARRYDIPLVMFFHSNFPRTICSFPEHASRGQRLAYDALWRYVRRLTREFEVTIAASEFMARDLAEHGTERIVQVPLGVDLEHFHPGRRAVASETRQDLDLPNDALVFGFLGRFAREKELEVLIDAWPAIEAGTDAYLAMIGDGPGRRRLMERARGKRILWRPYEGDREKVANILAALDLFICPGSIETFGLSALEAASSGTPVLAADRGGVSEQVRRSGGGAVFRAGDSDSLAEVAIQLARSAEDLPDLGSRGREYAMREHAWPIVFDRLCDVYRRVVA